ncbi:MAG: flagellin [Pseudomonadota bacterium]
MVLLALDWNSNTARLRVLQTQQQLASQALSIANNAPQALLVLFQS